MHYTSEEKETVCVYDYIDGMWEVYSCVPRHITKLRKAVGEPYWKEERTGRTGKVMLAAGRWKLNGNQIRFFAPFGSHAKQKTPSNS
ncbi:hypothetical protein [uncultured Brevibacillus sp.]|uniref:hypothetical protein n=1 Tax=uncultured Brevibacillus sp. TaxID=169970 RepID=UPI002598B670|nr:hypothetical protein [uncultured Brevibacillus sp.]